jgi:hypothetical protein
MVVPVEAFHITDRPSSSVLAVFVPSGLQETEFMKQ